MKSCWFVSTVQAFRISRRFFLLDAQHAHLCDQLSFPYISFIGTQPGTAEPESCSFTDDIMPTDSTTHFAPKRTVTGFSLSSQQELRTMGPELEEQTYEVPPELFAKVLSAKTRKKDAPAHKLESTDVIDNYNCSVGSQQSQFEPELEKSLRNFNGINI
ncbi:hypothetical protein BT96DRAFT_288986 [Gymnopus androsaceus JB14]|uniref:Uncharacterized protein n=1 Tax=Gymnopus androsaceus JB14 TaxID=1447944 RepID=A0A6A4H2T5_9AGAR|nr:hypothetical protein BT96DRAFT_288986 [Gymnopus androsaceus JB14]